MKGVIAAGDSQTAAAGAAILQQGGNAVDAAVAAAFASFIAEVGVVHLGGSGLAQLFDPHTGENVVYDFFSDMPGLGRARPVSALNFERVRIDYGAVTQEFFLGRGSVAVPGNIAGLCRLATDYGRLPLPTLLAPAIRLAEAGTELAPFQVDTCRLLEPLYTHTAGMRAIFAPHGRIIQDGERLFIPDLAPTLRALAAEGEAYARHGALAQAILADQAGRGGLLTATDLESYQVKQLTPLRLPYRDYDLLLPPPSSTGGVLVAFALKLLAAGHGAEWRHGSAGHLRLLLEIMAATNRARSYWEDMVESLPAAEASSRFLADTFTDPVVAELRQTMVSGRPSALGAEADQRNFTSHLSVIDGDGLAVGLTTTAGESAGYVVPGTGYIPNNMLGEADLHPHGFHSRPPGQRIPTMMTPTIVRQDGRIKMVVGSGGSTRIRSAILQTLNNFLDYRMPLAAAVNAPRVHLEDGVLQCEKGYEPTAVAELEAMGYQVNGWPKRSIYFGGAHSVAVDDSGRLVAAGDNRRGGAAIIITQ
jgi:gamma-glutamyltranspeptidase / glutathione hydrolase